MMENNPTQTITAPHEPEGKTGRPENHPYLFFVFSADQPLTASSRHCLADVDEVLLGRGERSAIRDSADDKRCLRLTVPDTCVSTSHVRLIKSFDRWLLEDTRSRNGTFVNGIRTAARAALFDGDLVGIGNSFFVFRAALPLVPEAPPDVFARAADAVPLGLNTLDPALTLAFRNLRSVAASHVSIVIQGESGTGKELIARAVHSLSGRPGRLVAVNCGATPKTLVASEFFGHCRGAFSDADRDRPGFIRESDRGTLFLDEIADLPGDAQSAFLRALQERQVLPLGSSRPIPVDIRLCCATHRDLDALVTQGVFRADLMARLTGHTVYLPALRERRQDFGIIIGDLLRRLCESRAEKIRFTREAAQAILGHRWPLNIRELEKCLERAVALAQDGLVKSEHLPSFGDGAAPALPPSSPPSSPAPRRPTSSGTWPPGAAGATPPTPSEPWPGPAGATLPPEKRQRREELQALLDTHGGNISAIARATGKERIQIRRWLRALQLDPEDYRPH